MFKLTCLNFFRAPLPFCNQPIAASGDERVDRFEASQDEAKEYIAQGDTKSETVGAATGDSQEYLGRDVTQQIEKQRKWLEL
jgi:hypothetical protein